MKFLKKKILRIGGVEKLSFFKKKEIVTVKFKVEISQNFAAFSEYMNFNHSLGFPIQKWFPSPQLLLWIIHACVCVR